MKKKYKKVVNCKPLKEDEIVELNDTIAFLLSEKAEIYSPNVLPKKVLLAVKARCENESKYTKIQIEKSLYSCIANALKKIRRKSNILVLSKVRDEGLFIEEILD